MASCSDSARKLAKEVWTLYGRHRYSTAMALSIISLEEIGKVWLLSIVCHAQVHEEDVDWRAFWKSWLSHDMKGGMASTIDLGLHGADVAFRTILPLLLSRLISVFLSDFPISYPYDFPHRDKHILGSSEIS